MAPSTHTDPFAESLDADAVASRLRDAGHRIVRVLGQDAPYDLLRAGGLTPIRLVARPGMPTPLADALIGTATLSEQGRSLLEQILQDESGDALLLTHANSTLPQIFAALRELLRTGDMPARAVHFFDLLHMDRASSRRYNEARLDQLIAWIGEHGRHGLNHAGAALADAAARHALLARAQALRDDSAQRLLGSEVLALIAAAHILPPQEWHTVAESAIDRAEQRAPQTGERLIVTGAEQLTPDLYTRLEAQGYHIVGDDQDWGDPLLSGCWEAASPWSTHFADPTVRVPRTLVRVADRVRAIAQLAQARDAAHVVHIIAPGDEASAWDAGTMTTLLRARGIAAQALDLADGTPDLTTLRANAPASPPSVSPPRPAARPSAPRSPRGDGRRSLKALKSVSTFGAYQREWFAGVRAAVADGAPFAVVNANSPQEMLRAMGIPFAVNQWWASIAAAKQQSGRYFELLRTHGYPANVESYSAQGLAAAFDEDKTAPWGGLPKPDFVQAVLSSDASPRIFDHWARETGADLFLFERTVDPRLDLPIDWWDSLPDRWDAVLEAERITLLTEELRDAIGRIERASGKYFDAGQFRTIMRLVNEQEDYYRRTRDLIAASYPVPVSIADTMPATMVPQWHRGTEWARDAAKAFYDEVKDRVDRGDAACPNERIRLMWVGRGMWSDMGFYQRWQESHGAVFVWSMYLSLAADGYIRHFDDQDTGARDPMRALAARFVTMGDELRMPTWAGAWHVREAETHGIDGAIALSDADPFVVRALERAGVPVLALDLDNYNREASDTDYVDRAITGFLEGAAQQHAKMRR